MEWKKVVGYEGLYEVSNTGLVKSLERTKVCGHKGSKPQIVKEKLMTIKLDRSGYPRVKLSKDGNSKLCTVHRLVALSFLENNSNKKEVNHKDGNKENNNVCNLEWNTRAEKMKHASNQGLLERTKDKNCYRFNAKINMDIAEDIRKMRLNGFKMKEISEKFDVSLSTVSAICNNKIWRDL